MCCLAKSDDRMRRLGHDRLKTFGVGQELSSNEWRSVFRQLIAAGFLNVDMAQRAGFRLNEKSWEILKGERAVCFRKDQRPVKKTKKLRPMIKTATSLSDHDDRKLWETLRSLRFQIARKSGVPPYVVFSDKTLKEMVALRPTSAEELLQVSGVGEVKLKRYGDIFLGVIKEAGNETEFPLEGERG